jgi:hypothetical protein
MWTGCYIVLLVPSPNVHSQLIGALAEVSLNVTLSGALPVVGEAVKLATGGAGTRMGERFLKKTIGKRMEGAGGLAPALFVHIALLWVVPSGLHMIQYPVPHPSKNFVLLVFRVFNPQHRGARG